MPAGAAGVGAGVAGRTRVRLVHPEGGTCDAYAHGAQVLSWRPPGSDDMLFLSARIGDRQIAHGGVPIVFPQFGGGALPQHGFARTSEWAVGPTSTDAEGRSVVTLTLDAQPDTHALWPHDFRLVLDVALGASLTMTMRASNPGREPFTFTGGFHTYFRVRDVRRCALGGLAGARYRDKTRDFAESVDDAKTLVPRGETDRVYLSAPVVRIDDGERVIRVESRGFANVVVWNPGPEGDARFDFAPGEWTQFVCVEPATVTAPVTLAPGATWEGMQRLELQPVAGKAAGSR